MIKKIKNYIDKSDFVKNTLTLFTGTTIAQIIPILISPILSRLYTPGDFGILAIYMSFASVLSVFATGRYELAIMLPKKDEDAINLFSLSILISIIISVITFFVVIFFNEQITKLSGNGKLSFFLYFLPLSVLSLGIYKSLNYWFNRTDKFNNIALSKVVATSSNSTIALIIGILKKGSYGLVFAWILGQFSSMVFLMRKMLITNKESFGNVNKVKIVALLRRYKKFPLFDTWSELLNVLSVQLPIIIVIWFFGEDITGHFSFAYKILLLPFSLLAFSMGQAFFKKANELRSSGNDISNFTFNVFKKLVLISFVPLAVIGMFGDYIFPFIFGKEWLTAGEYSRIISLWAFAIFLSSPLTTLFAVYEKQRTNFIFNLITFIFRISLLIGISIVTKDDFSAIFWYAISGFIFRFLYLLIIMKIARLELYKVFFEIIKYTVPIIGILTVIRIVFT